MSQRAQRRDRRPGPWDEPSTRVGKHGLSGADIASMVRQQGGRCVACGGPLDEPQVDHDHRLAARHDHLERYGCPLCVRGLIDRRCNSILGFADDSPERLRAVADYVEEARRRAGTL